MFTVVDVLVGVGVDLALLGIRVPSPDFETAVREVPVPGGVPF